MKDISQAYETLYSRVLVPVASALESTIREWLTDQPRIDRIAARAKSPDRFLVKAAKLKDDGSPKYVDPLEEIQDQIGARVTVFYLSDVSAVGQTLEKYLKSREMKWMAPTVDEEFGYFGRHFIFELPAESIPRHLERNDAPEVFELQVKTLFQHAWSEANHDLGYKASGDLTPGQKRLLAYSSAQAWGADRVFAELHDALDSPR